MYYTKPMREVKREMRIRKARVTSAKLKYTLSLLLSRFTLPNSTISILLIAGALFTAHATV